MACGCGKSRDNSLAGKMLKAESDLQLNEAGMYDLYVAPGCTEKYHGGFLVATVYIAGRNTPAEKTFRRSQWNEAQDYARRNNVGLVHLAATSLCHETMVELLGA
jgi:hypothetical protein